jgi:hypothetical protein
MVQDIPFSRYRCVATSVEGFIQQVAVSYIRTGHFFYVSGTLDADVDAEAIDAKLIHKYGVDVSRWGRALRKANGEANLQYIRHDRFFLLMATHGRSLFFELEGEQVNDCRRQPIKYGPYSISHRGGHPHVRIDLEAYMGFKAQMLEESLRRERDALERMMSIPLFVPYAPVRRQLWNVCREMNRVRSAAGLSSLRTECLNFRRRIVRPFGEPVVTIVGIDASMGGSSLEVSSMQDFEEWKRLNGPGREDVPRSPNADLPRDWRELQKGAKPVDLGVTKTEPKTMFPVGWDTGPREDDRDPNQQGGGLGNLWPDKRPNGPGRGREPGR